MNVSFRTEDGGGCAAAAAAVLALIVTVSKWPFGEGGECISVELLSFCGAELLWVVAAVAPFRGLSAGDAVKLTQMVFRKWFTRPF